MNIHSSTAISGVESLACATATLCVAGDGVGDATTYAIPPTAGKPTLTGTPSVGHTLTLGHAPVQTQPVWRADDWRRCASPDASCTLSPISTSQTGYALAAADANRYIDVRETVGFGFDEEGPLVSDIVGSVAGPRDRHVCRLGDDHAGWRRDRRLAVRGRTLQGGGRSEL